MLAGLKVLDKEQAAQLERDEKKQRKKEHKKEHKREKKKRSKGRRDGQQEVDSDGAGTSGPEDPSHDAGRGGDVEAAGDGAAGQERPALARESWMTVPVKRGAVVAEGGHHPVSAAAADPDNPPVSVRIHHLL